jgi:lysophospholipase L1-like esterase
MRQLFLLLALTLTAVACRAPADTAQTAPLDEPFRVLLLGDSISMGYTAFVREALGERALVSRPMVTRLDKEGNERESAENCAGTNNAMEHLDRWLATGGGDWDVIHFNFGLHDLKRVDAETGKNSNSPGDPHQADPARYEAQLRTIATRLRETDARLVFATTTPVPEGELRPHRAPADSPAYNAVAIRVMKEEGIPVNDLFDFVTTFPETIQPPANVHFTKEGSRALGDRVAEAILEVGAGSAVREPGNASVLSR